MVMDNLLGTHKGQKVRELIEERGCRRLLPGAVLSPGFNPIEEAAFSKKIKGALRKAQPPTAKP